MDQDYADIMEEARQRKQVCVFLVYLFTKLGQTVPGDIQRAADHPMGVGVVLAKVEARLIHLVQALNPNKTRQLIGNGIEQISNDLEIWINEQKTKHFNALSSQWQKLETKEKQKAWLKTLTPYERIILGQ
jgi:hypothetical protein